jgi:hypothetical protein
VRRFTAVGALAVAGALVAGGCDTTRSDDVARGDDAVLATPGHDVSSPSGAFDLRVVDGDDGWHVEIVGDDGAVEHVADRSFSPRFRTYVLWDDDDRVWVYSSDVGTYVWERADDETWSDRPWRGSGLTAPAHLRRAVPERFG